MMSMDQKRILLTGGSSGIGEQCARKLLDQGAEVIVLDRNPCLVDGVEFHQVDMTDRDAVAAVVAGLVDGPFDALLNVAGLPPRDGNEALLYDVNFFALRHLTGLMMDRLADNAAIVNVASLAGSQWVQNIDQVKQLLSMDEGTDGDQAHQSSVFTGAPCLCPDQRSGHCLDSAADSQWLASWGTDEFRIACRCEHGHSR